MSRKPDDGVKAWAVTAANEQVRAVLANARAAGVDPTMQMDAMIITSKIIIELAEQAKAEIEKEQDNGQLH